MFREMSGHAAGMWGTGTGTQTLFW